MGKPCIICKVLFKISFVLQIVTFLLVSYLSIKWLAALVRKGYNCSEGYQGAVGMREREGTGKDMKEWQDALSNPETHCGTRGHTGQQCAVYSPGHIIFPVKVTCLLASFVSESAAIGILLRCTSSCKL